MPILKVGESEAASHIFEGHGLDVQKGTDGNLRMAAPLQQRPLIDISWLPLASPAYQISPKIADYVFVEIPIVTADVPNRNLDCFTLGELLRFDVQSGRPVFGSFVGKPTHADHDNKNPLKAKGVIFDAYMVPMEIRGHRYVKVKILAGWDRTKDTALVQKILQRERVAHSMGAWVDYTQCSYCGGIAKSGQITCHQKGQIIGGKLVYETCGGVNFIESSSVEDPADFDAVDGGVKNHPQAA
jgi:hypothetical protein